MALARFQRNLRALPSHPRIERHLNTDDSLFGSIDSGGPLHDGNGELDSEGLPSGFRELKEAERNPVQAPKPRISAASGFAEWEGTQDLRDSEGRDCRAIFRFRASVHAD